MGPCHDLSARKNTRERCSASGSPIRPGKLATRFRWDLQAGRAEFERTYRCRSAWRAESATRNSSPTKSSPARAAWWRVRRGSALSGTPRSLPAFGYRPVSDGRKGKARPRWSFALINRWSAATVVQRLCDLRLPSRSRRDPSPTRERLQAANRHLGSWEWIEENLRQSAIRSAPRHRRAGRLSWKPAFFVNWSLMRPISVINEGRSGIHGHSAGQP